MRQNKHQTSIVQLWYLAQWTFAHIESYNKYKCILEYNIFDDIIKWITIKDK